MAKVLKSRAAFIALCISLFCTNGYSANVEQEVWQLRKLATAVRIYMDANNGQIPSNLEPLGDYIDVAKMFNVAAGSSAGLTDRYSLLSAKPTISLPGKGEVQVILLGIKPEDGRRMAIWIGKDGLPDTGLLRESELIAAAGTAVDLQNLKPMGGVVPKTSAKVLAATADTGVTEYQARVLALAREGKLEPDPPYHPGTNEVIPSQGITPTTNLPTSPKPIASAASTPKTEAKESPSPSFPIVPVAIIAAVIVGVIVFLIRRK